MIQLEIALVKTPEGRCQARVFSPDEPGTVLHLTPIPRELEDDAMRDARAWIWENHPDSNFGNLDALD